MTTVIFETATIADALKKAEKCAPKAKDNEGFGSSAGLVLEVRPGMPEGWKVCIRSNNSDTFYMEWVDDLGIEGDATDWRISSYIVSSVVGALPMKAGATVEFSDEKGMLRIKSNRTTGRVSLMPLQGYPIWEPYSEEETAVVKDLGEKINQIVWACDSSGSEANIALAGIHFSGTHLIATDRHVCAMVPCEVPIAGQGLNVSAKDLGKVIRHSGDVRVGALERQLAVSPDDRTQIRCTVYDVKYPDTSVFIGQEYDSSVTIDKELFLNMIQRMTPVTKGMDVPLVKMMLGGGEMNLRMQGAIGSESIEDAIELPGEADHLPVILSFVPRIISDGIGRSPDSKVTLYYNAEVGKTNKFVHVDGGNGYKSWFVQTLGKRNSGG